MTTHIISRKYLNTEFTTPTMQPERAPATKSTNVGASAVEVAGGCRVCGKSPDQVEFSNSQRRRLKRGKVATCKACASPDDSGCSGAASVAVSVRSSPDGGRAITGTESSKVSMESVQVMHSGGYGRYNALAHIRVGFMAKG